MAEITLRYNASAEEVELVVDGEVAATSGTDVFKSWVDAYNSAHPADPVTVEVVKEVLVERVPDKRVDVTPESGVESSTKASEPAEAVAEVEAPVETEETAS